MATASLNAIRQYLPRGNTLDDDAFFTRHGWLCWLLGLHVPLLLAFGMVEGFGFEHSLTAVWVPMACLLVALHIRRRRVVSTRGHRRPPVLLDDPRAPLGRRVRGVPARARPAAVHGAVPGLAAGLLRRQRTRWCPR